MDYRDERDALRARVESLEGQLEDAKKDAQARQNADPARIAQVQAHIAEAEAHVYRVRGEVAALGGAGSAAPRRVPVALVVMVVMMLSMGSTFWILLRRSPAPRSAAAQASLPVAVTVASVPATPARAAAAATATDYFHDATSVPGAFQAKIGGPVRVLELNVYDTYVIAEVQDPKNHENVDRYILRDGIVGDGSPIMLSGQMKTAKDVDAAVLDLATVDFSLVPKMVEEAKARLGIEDGKVSHVHLDGTRVFQKDVRWDVYVSSPRKSGFVELDTAGHVERVSK